jgi:competence protein ComEC
MDFRAGKYRAGKYRAEAFRAGAFRAGMFACSLAFLLGVMLVQQLAELPTRQQLAGLLLGLVVAATFFVYFNKQKCTFPHRLLRCCFYQNYSFQDYSYQNCFFQSRSFRNVSSKVWDSAFKQYTLIISFILLIVLGYCYAVVYANQQLSYRLNEDFVGKNLLVNGTIASIPVDGEKGQRFEFNVEQLNFVDTGNTRDNTALKSPAIILKKIRLSWYYGTAVNAGEKWQFEVRLKPPHGFQNPGGFDYEGWLFQHGIQATGYIRQSELNKKQSMSIDGVFLPGLDRLYIDGIRQRLGDRIDEVAQQSFTDEKSKSFALIKALAIGDKSSISKQQWQVLTATGTSHLMAISGLHIGLAALFAYVLIRRLVPVSIIKILPAQHVALIGGLFVALLYALVAGFSVPTQRAFIMLFILSMMMLIRRNHRPVDALGFALIVVLLIDPLAVLSAGFWFSFSAVAVIFISVDSYSNEAYKQQDSPLDHTWQKVLFIVKKWIRLQFLISLFLLPLSLFMFQQVSLVSPLANLLLIPYVSFLVVPLVLLALCVTYLSPELADHLFYYAASMLDFIWPALTYLSELPYALWIKGDVGTAILLMSTAGIAVVYFSRSLFRPVVEKYNSKWLRAGAYLSILVIASSLLLPLFYQGDPLLQHTEYKVTVLDVGQGSAAVVQTKNHVLVFDTGAKYSEKFDVGSAVVIPYLRSQGIRFIDRLIISHGDADHIGGAEAVLNAFPSAAVVGRNIERLLSDNKQPCVAGLEWYWDGVSFEFLSPQMLSEEAELDEKKAVAGKRNNMSCVLKVSSPAGSALFTGDIEKIVERRLVEKTAGMLKSDLLIVPHHGSKTSSGQHFLDTVDAKISIFSVGYQNRYKLPNKHVLSRYQATDSDIFRTDKNGAITLTFLTDKSTQIEKYRESSKRYWHHSME